MIALAPGLIWRPAYFSREEQQALLDDIRAVLRTAPLFTPAMPRTGKPFSVRMSNCGPLGWVSDRDGYRYQSRHPQTGAPWPAIPQRLLDLWAAVAGYERPPQACLVNYYHPAARMGLHVDGDEQELRAPVVSVSLGATCLFRYGGARRADPTRSLKLQSGDVIVIGGASRLVYHGVDRLYPATSTLVAGDGRVNLTLRRISSGD
ncbi:MAG: alpha-ketoglutarate-dependent dioxygenase AlkB [Hyphomicrobiales bacterium]|nr:alpha-ketoglutarate-dependent dioxygenase AlkB [Hyphomicrobiales bacterium]